MSAVEAPERSQPAPVPIAEPELESRPAEAGSKRPERGGRRSRRPSESVVIFTLLFSVYALIGYRVVITQHVVVFDSMSHLAHAYFALHNDPAKLAAIGFEWPPVMTLVFLPLAVFKPLASSLIAIPLTSALFAAALIVILNRTLTLLELPRAMRFSLLALFALNPLVVFYATNGMAEMVYLALLALGLHFLIRWHLSGQSHLLALSGVAFAIAVLTRYEMVAFAAVAGLGMIVLLLARRAPRKEIEGDTILFGAPIVYGVGAWFFFNWLIVGDPLFWIKRQAEKNVTVGRGDVDKVDLPSIPLADIGQKLLDLNAQLFPLLLLVLPLLLVAALRRRDPMSLILAAFVSLNAAMTFLLVLNSHDLSLLQLRYNMRALPIVIVAVGWLCWLARDRARLRIGVWAASVLVLAATIPIVWSTMKTYPYQFDESAFVAAISTGEDQAGTRSIGGYEIGLTEAEEMADYIDGRITKPSSIFTDDESITQEVMLLGGRPDLFFDRIDRGDEKWRPVLASPWGRTDYILLSRSTFAPDQIQQCYPSAKRGRMPGTTLLQSNDQFVLLSVDERAPRGERAPFPPGCPLAP